MSKALSSLLILAALPAAAAVVRLKAASTVAGVELDAGDAVEFTLRNGATRRLELLSATARVLLSNLKTPRKAQPDGGTLYAIYIVVKVDGHPLTLTRFVGSQESFSEPYTVNGLRIWPDFARPALELMTDNHGGKSGCSLTKLARIALHDASDSIAPIPLAAWLPLKRQTLSIADAYNGDDPYMGAYQGAECHAGLDINHPKGFPLFAPIPVDDHYYFDSLAAGQNNNRWRGIRKWPNGDVWTIQSHHLVKLLVPPHTPLASGQRYASGGGVLPGNNEHSHFVFKVASQGLAEVPLDAWMLFWQYFEQQNSASGSIRATMRFEGPLKTGQPARFSSRPSRKGPWGDRLRAFWTFGDGSFSTDPEPLHAYAKPGIYAVTLVVDDGVDRAAASQLVTVDGTAPDKPTFQLKPAGREPSFSVRRPDVRDVYGSAPSSLPHTLLFTASPKSPAPMHASFQRSGDARLRCSDPSVAFWEEGGWLQVSAGGQIEASAAALTPGHYFAEVSVRCDSALNPVESFLVHLDVRQDGPPTEVVIDNEGPGFHATPHFWVGHRFKRWPRAGVEGFYLTNGGDSRENEFVRFRPVLRAGRYEVSFAEETPFGLAPDAAYPVTVQSAAGSTRLSVHPAKSRRIGVFDFDAGTAGYVDIDSAAGTLLIDALVFRRLP